MPSHLISFEVRKGDTVEFPVQLLTDGRYKFVVHEDRSVDISGNRDGFLYLAEVLVRLALGGYAPGFHAHLPLSSESGGPNIDMSPELTIIASE